MAAPKEKEKIITAFILDFETGGLNCQKSAATQLSVHAVRLDTFELMETYNMYFYPYSYKCLEKPMKKTLRTKQEKENEEVEMEYGEVALKYSGITMQQLLNHGVELQKACEELIEFFKRNKFDVKPSDKPFIVGQNILFDLGFLTQILLYTNLWDDFSKIVRGHKDYWGNFQPYYVDTILFCQLALGDKKDVPSWKLEVEAERLGIDLDDAHDADADVTATEEILRILSMRMRNDDVQANGQFQIGQLKKEKTRDHFKI